MSATRYDHFEASSLLTTRRDKLILIIETGTSQQVRRTAAKQLADLLVKTYNFARQTPDIKPTNPDALTVGASEEEAWTEVLEAIAKILPVLGSKYTEARLAAAHALGLIAAALPGSLHLDPIDAITFPSILRDPLLLASAGKEYVGKTANKAKARKAMLGEMGLDNGVEIGEDLDKIVEDEVNTEGLSARQITMLKRKKGNMAEEANK